MVSYRDRVLPEVTVTLTGEDQSTYSYVTNAKGYYYFRNLPAGNYDVTLSYDSKNVASYIEHYENTETPNRITVEANGYHVRNMIILSSEDLGFGEEPNDDDDTDDYTLPEVELPILAWYSIPAASATLQRYQELKECGFNISFSHLSTLADAKKALELGGQAGVKIMFTCSDLESNTAEIVSQVKDDPALYGYFLRDEPTDADLENLGEWADRIRTADPDHPIYFNLFPNYVDEATLGSTYEEYVKKAISTIKPNQVSFDFYPIHDDGIVDSWWENLEIIRTQSEAANLPIWAFALSTPHGPYPIPELAHLRIQMYTNLAYGAQCLQYFTYWCPTPGTWDFHDAPIAENGSRTDTWELVKTMNEELQARAGVFVGAKVLGVYQTGSTQPRGTHPLTGSNPPLVKLSMEDNGAVMAFLENGKWEYLVMVNRNYDSGFSYSIEFEVDVQTIDKKGTIEDIGTDAESFLDAGDCAIFRWKKK